MLRFTLITLEILCLVGCHHAVQEASYESHSAEQAVAISDMTDFAHRY